MSETGQGDDTAPVAASIEWLTSRGLLDANLAAFAVCKESGVSGIKVDDVLILDCDPGPKLDGSAFAFFPNRMAGAEVEHLYEYHKAGIVASTSAGGGLATLEFSGGFSILGKVVGLFRDIEDAGSTQDEKSRR